MTKRNSGAGRDGEKTNVTKDCNELEVVESHHHSCSEGIRRIEGDTEKASKCSVPCLSQEGKASRTFAF